MHVVAGAGTHMAGDPAAAVSGTSAASGGMGGVSGNANAATGGSGGSSAARPKVTAAAGTTLVRIDPNQTGRALHRH